MRLVLARPRKSETRKASQEQRHLGLRNALGLAEAGIAIMHNQIIIGEGGRRERDKRSVSRLIQSNLGGREGTAVLGTKKKGRGRSRLSAQPKIGGDNTSGGLGVLPWAPPGPFTLYPLSIGPFCG